MESTSSAVSGHLQDHDDLQDVVIIGGGIAGLATALALLRMGLKPKVLEQSAQLQTTGSAIGLWTNAWKALDALGVGNSLREKGDRLSGIEFSTADGSILASFNFKDAERDVEVRAVERKALLEAISEPLPDGIVSYGVQVSKICKINGGYTKIECKDGQKLRTKVLIGCDGVKSVVGKWMGFKEVKHAGYTAIRGLAMFPDGLKQKPTAQQIVGQGVRVGMIPMDSKHIFWFLVFNTKGERISDPQLIRDEALMHVRRGWPTIVTETIKHTAIDSLSRRDVADRWMCPVLWGSPALYRGGVTVAGDAMHPLTPNLAQGGCCALEDAVVLARHVGRALLGTRDLLQRPDGQCEMDRIQEALKSYTEERWPRMLGITIKSYIIGALLQVENGVFCSLRKYLLPKLLTLNGFTSHTFYDCGLPQN